MNDRSLPLEQIRVEDDRTGMEIETIERAFADNLFYLQAKFPRIATRNDYYMALAYTVRDRMLHRFINTVQTYIEQDVRVVAYFSAEFLVGPHLGNNLMNLGISDQVRQAVEAAGLDLEKLLDQEEEPGLGNGGLGRLAACYLDSAATLQIPVVGYGIRYEFGIFDQEIRDGWQVEITDKWLRFGNPWEIPRPEAAQYVKFGGHTEPYVDEEGVYRVKWIPAQMVKGVPYDTPITGYRVNTVNPLRLWKAEAVESFDFEAFNVGDYYGAVDEKVISETLTKMLYPNDEPEKGKRLRLQQQYFFVSCALQDMLSMHLFRNGRLEDFSDKWSVQLNDTHPSIAVAELMRLLVDDHHMGWERAWGITTRTFAYTNHTLLPEALEKWPVPLFAELLPRHLEIIYEINHHFLEEVRQRFPGDEERVARMSLIDESGVRYVRMAHLAVVGSHTVNGVAELHTELLRSDVLRDFNEFEPKKLTNKTNGITPRRFLLFSNPGLAALITEYIGDHWVTDLDVLRELEPYADDQDFQLRWRDAKGENKANLAAYLDHTTGIRVEPDNLFDIQVKRLHEYKRQHLNILHVISLYNRIKQNPEIAMTSRTVIFGGKAAPGYYQAKLIIRLINGVGEVVNNDHDVAGRLKVVFLPNFNVKNSRHVFPAADLSEQISMAGKEASGTGNMKFALNGALTIGTLDGANIEIREEVGEENFFLFGLTAAEVRETKQQGYDPRTYYRSDTELREAIDRIASGHFSRGDPHLFRPLVDNLLGHGPYLLLADYRSYIDCQDRVAEAWRDPARWTRMSILNVARMGRFSSDRAVREYRDDIWRVKPVPISLNR
ncbi:glycogen/starch/alpha-glucan phosphorylase [Thiohalomonas denitrificans]|uniref:glycogen/starch/alpha-glucan phosphorylase n=1 Tax=Thiohalomonas denitrificans TaxID=415747 RepID=UPI0026EEFDC1|nr:glycogen/starch/alpha-glucan phosphorylase [Thiohalomonas denitrificans]